LSIFHHRSGGVNCEGGGRQGDIYLPRAIFSLSPLDFENIFLNGVFVENHLFCIYTEKLEKQIWVEFVVFSIGKSMVKQQICLTLEFELLKNILLLPPSFREISWKPLRESRAL